MPSQPHSQLHSGCVVAWLGMRLTLSSHVSYNVVDYQFLFQKLILISIALPIKLLKICLQYLQQYCMCYLQYCMCYLQYCMCYLQYCMCYLQYCMCYLQYCMCYLQYCMCYLQYCMCYLQYCICYLVLVYITPRCDQNHDGTIDYTEFTKYLTGTHTYMCMHILYMADSACVTPPPPPPPPPSTHGGPQHGGRVCEYTLCYLLQKQQHTGGGENMP